MQDSLNFADRKDVEVLGYVCTCAAALALLARHRIALMLSAVAGFGMLIWIFAELAIIRQYSRLQAAYFGLGAMELIFVLALLGIVPALVVPLQGSDRQLPNRSATHG